MKKSDLNLAPATRFLLLFLLLFVGLVLAGIISVVIGFAVPTGSVPFIRIATVVQDLLVFMLPAVATALIVCRRPAELLCINRNVPTVWIWVAVVAMLCVSAPFQEAVAWWNQNITLPDSLAALQEHMRQLEDNAQAVVVQMLTQHTAANLLINILIIGVLAGLTEELLFRGCIQRLMTTAGVNIHVAIWVTAVIFSLVHLQIFGFVPRMLLGAYMGYLLVWTRSLWAPVAAHVLNNSVYVVAAYIDPSALKADTSCPNGWLIAASTFGTALVLWTIHTLCRQRKNDIS